MGIVLPTDSEGFARLLRRQRGLFSGSQAAAVGVDARTLRARARRGELDRLAPNVHRHPGRAPDHADLALAEILALRGRPVASHGSALHLWGLGPAPGFVELSGANRSSRAGLVVHESVVSGRDRGTLGGVPITSPTRTLLDVAAVLPPVILARAVGDACLRKLTDTDRLRRAADATTGRQRPGGVAVLALLAAGTVTDSALEDRFAALVREAGLPAPARQYRIEGCAGPFDFAYPEARLLIELDGTRVHAPPEQQRRDARKQTAAVAAGWRVVRFTWDDVVRTPERVIAVLQDLLR